MIGLFISSLHLAGALVGLWAIRRTALAGRSDRVLGWVAFVASGVMASYVFVTTPVSPRLEDLRRWILFYDFESAYYAAGRALLGEPSDLLPVLQKGVDGFVCLPITAYPFLPFGLISDVRVAGLLYTVAGCGAVLFGWRMISVHYRFDRYESLLALFAAACYGPLLYSVREGNLSHVMLPALMLGLYLVLERRDLLAGVVFGVLAVFKPLLLVVGAYFFLRRRFSAVAGGALVGIVSLGLSIAVFGWDMHLVWYQDTVASFGSDPIPAFNAQSISSFVSRFETGPAGYADWSPHSLSPLGNVLVWALSAMILAVGVWAASKSKRIGTCASDKETECEVHLALIIMCLISPLVWSHYFVWLLPAFAFLFMLIRRGKVSGIIITATIAAFVLSAPIEYLDWNYGGSLLLDVLGNLVVSHRLFGSLLLFAVLVWTRRHLTELQGSASACGITTAARSVSAVDGDP